MTTATPDRAVTAPEPGEPEQPSRRGSDRRHRRRGPLEVAALIVGTVAVLAISYPLLRILQELFFGEGGFGFDAFREAAALPGLSRTVLNTAVLVGLSGTIALVLGSLFAWLNERTDARMPLVSSIMPVLPMLLPPIAAAIGWVFLLSPRAGILNVALRDLFGMEGGEGPINIYSWPGLVILCGLELTPFVYLIMAAALRNIDPALEQASRVCGAGPVSTALRVTLPAVRPALTSATLLVVTIGLALFSVPAVIGTSADIDVLSVRIVQLLADFPARTDVAVVLGFGVLVVIGIAAVAQARMLRRGRNAVAGGKGIRAARVELGVWRWPARMLTVVYVLASTVLPIAGLLVVSLQPFWSPDIRWSSISLDAYRELWSGSPLVRRALTNSVILGLLAASIGMGAAWLLALYQRRSPGRLAAALDGIVKVPAGLSHVVLALGLLLAFAGPPFGLGQTLTILLIAYVVIYLPQASITARSAVSQVDRQLEEASHVAGAGDARTLRRISLPLMLPGIASGWALLFVFAIGDVTASVVLAGTSTPTAGYTLYVRYLSGTYPLIAALALSISVVSAVVVLSVLRLTRGKVGVSQSG